MRKVAAPKPSQTADSTAMKGWLKFCGKPYEIKMDEISKGEPFHFCSRMELPKKLCISTMNVKYVYHGFKYLFYCRLIFAL